MVTDASGPANSWPGREATRVDDIGNQTVERLPDEVCDAKVCFAGVEARRPVDRRWSRLLSLRDPASSRPGHPPKQRQSSADRDINESKGSPARRSRNQSERMMMRNPGNQESEIL